MEEFAGVDLAKINVKSAESLAVTRECFLKHYTDVYVMPHEHIDATNVIQALRGYIRLKLTPTRNLEQAMALLIRYLPDDNVHTGDSNDNLELLLLKMQLKESKYDDIDLRDLSFKKRYKLVTEIKYKICDDDEEWEHAVDSVYNSYYRKALAIANAELDKIKQMSNARGEHIRDRQLAYICSLQIAYYAEIINYLRNFLLDAELQRFNKTVEIELHTSVNQLRALSFPSIKPSTSCKDCLLFLHDQSASFETTRYQARKNFLLQQ